MWQLVEILKVLNTLTLKLIFWKMKSFFKKLEYRFLVESSKIENASSPDKTAISEANVKISRMVSTKRTYYKEHSFASYYFIILKILLQFNLSRPNLNFYFHTSLWCLKRFYETL